MSGLRVLVIGDVHLDPRCEKAAIRDRVISGQSQLFRKIEAYANDPANSIGDIVFTGDLFTNQAYLTSQSVETASWLFGTALANHRVHIIAGNHDFLNDDDSVYSGSFLEHFSNVHVIRHRRETVEICGREWTFVPWVFPSEIENLKEWLTEMASRPAEKIAGTVIVGHFDMLGMLMEAGQESLGGLSPALFSRAAGCVISGHYHCKSVTKIGGSVITYVGTPYHLTFAHVGTDCGFWVYDGNPELSFVENTESPRFVDVRDDDDLDALPDLSNSFVRLFMDNARQFEEQAEIKMKVNDKHPIYIHPISYGGDSGSIEECKGTDDSRDAAMIHTTDIDMARMYMDRFPDRLPQLSGGKDPKSVILGQLEKYV